MFVSQTLAFQSVCPLATAGGSDSKKLNRPPILRSEGPMAGFKTCSRVLVRRLATAHRPTVPPRGERTVAPVITIAVAVTHHFAGKDYAADSTESSSG